LQRPLGDVVVALAHLEVGAQGGEQLDQQVSLGVLHGIEDRPVDAGFRSGNAARAWQEPKRLTEGVQGV
jgi:hypothetical protein